MWVSRYTDAPRVVFRRIVLLLAAAMTAAVFVVGSTLTQTAYAADATWEGSNIRYNSQVFSPESTTDPPSPLPANDPRGMSGRIAYTWIETVSAGDQRAHTIYLDSGYDRSTEVNGSLIIYAYEPPSTYSTPTSPQSLTISADLTAQTQNERPAGECSVAGIGWIVCPLSRWISEGVDFGYRLIKDFLEVPAVTTDPSTGLYAVWGIVRSIANVCFIAAILIIIYSQITNIGISNYGIKTMLPRIIIAAVLVNISFWVAALAVDASNLIGYSIHAIFENVRLNLPQNIQVDWSILTAFILSGGAVTGGLVFVGAVAGSITGLGFLLISALLSVAFGIFVALVILAARQAILTVLIIIAPLAFVAFILPSTKRWFDMWRNSFTTLLIFFPLFALLFGGASLAGAIIMNNAADRLHIVLMGLTVQVIPLVITPLLIRFSTGLLGRIAGMANTKSGAIDRAKGWAKSNADYHKDRALGQESTKNPFKGIARKLDRSNRARDNRREAYKANADTMARGYRDKKTGEWRDRRGWVQSDIMKRTSEDQQKVAQSRNDAQYSEFSAYRSGDPDAKNPYNITDGYVRRHASRPTLNGMPVFARSSEAILRDDPNIDRDSSYDAARDIAINAIRQQQANEVRSNQYNRDLKLNADLQTVATGIGSRDLMLAGVIAKERKEYGEQVAAQDQLMKHFKLDSSEWQNLATAKTSVAKTKDGLTHEFKITNEYAREAAIEHQISSGSAGQIREIVNESGREVHVMRPDGTVDVRAGVNFDHRSTIQDAVIKAGVAGKVPYINDKSYDQIIKGEWKGPISESTNALREIVEGRLKIDNLVGANDGALEVIYQIGELKRGVRPGDRGKYDYYKQQVLNMIGDPAERSRAAATFDATFDSNFTDIRKIATDILSDNQIAQRASLASREVFDRYKL